MLFLHWVGNRMLSLVTNVLYNTTLSDMETCYKLVDRALLARPRPAVRPLRHRAGDHREDPEARDPHLRGADLLHGPRVRRGQEDHVARRLRGIVDARQVPLWRLTHAAGAAGAGPPSSSTSRPGPLLDGVRARRCWPTRAPGAVELVVVDNGSRDGSVDALLARASRRARRPRARQRRLRPRREPRHRRDEGADRRGAEPRHRRRAGRGRRAASAGSSTSRGSARAGPGCATSTAPTTRRPGRFPSIPVAVGHGLLGLWWPTNPFTARYRQLDADPARPAPGRLGLGRRDLAAPARRSTRSAAGTSATSCTSRTPTCAGGCAARAGRSRTSRRRVVVHVQGASASRRPYRMLLEHHRSAWRFARVAAHRRPRRAAPVRRGVLRGARGHGDGRARVAGVPVVTAVADELRRLACAA